MAITVTEIKKRIRILTDEYASAYLSDTQYTTLWNKASVRFFSKEISKWQITKNVSQYLQSICTKGNATVSSFVVDTSVITNFWKLQNIKPTYTDSGKTYSKYARELKSVEKGSVYSSGTYMNPRYTFNNDGITLYPQTGTCTKSHTHIDKRTH